MYITHRQGKALGYSGVRGVESPGLTIPTQVVSGRGTVHIQNKRNVLAAHVLRYNSYCPLVHVDAEVYGASAAHMAPRLQRSEARTERA